MPPEEAWTTASGAIPKAAPSNGAHPAEVVPLHQGEGPRGDPNSSAANQPSEMSRRWANWRLVDQPLAVQFLIAGGIVAFFSIVSLVLLIRQVDSQTEASRFVHQTYRVKTRLIRLERDFEQQKTAVLAFLRTRDQRSLKSVVQGRKQWQEEMQVIDQLVVAKEERDFLVDLQTSYRKWYQVTERMIRSLDALPTGAVTVLTEQPAPTIDEASLEQERDLFDRTARIIDRLRDAGDQQLQIRDAREKTATRATFTAIAVLNVVLLVIVGIVLAKLYFSFARPIADLSETMQRYEGGDFKARVRVSNRSQIGYLESNFNEMAEKIEVMVADLRQLDVLKSEFISTVSHELRTPLTSIGGYVRLIISGDVGDISETQREFLHIVDTNVVRLTHLINDLLDVEKMEEGKVQLVKEPLDLSEVLRECRDTFGIVANQKNLELKYNVADGLPPVLGDRGRLVQVFMNLISNAIKYTIQGSVSIEAEEREFAVSVRIRDTGVGLTPEEKEKLFQKFYRTRSGLTSSEGGTGLGLVIVRGLVEAHGGTIVVDSVPGQGTCFTLTFPATASIVNVEELVQVAPDSDAGPESQVWQRPVWIIDPDQRSVESMTRILEDAGPQFKGYSISVVRFASIHEVPEVVSADQTPYLVVVDPIDGGAAQVIPALRTRVHKTVPILVASSSVDAIEVFAEGASALVTKPIGEREFLIAVKDLMGGKGWRVLIADRNTDLRILIKRSLEQRGFIVDDVDRGSQVLARLDQEDYDLALIDMNFSDVSGPDLLRVIRKGERFKSLSVFVMLEEDKNIPTEADLAAWGANAYVGKDKGIGGIVDSVCQYLEDRKLIEHPT